MLIHCQLNIGSFLRAPMLSLYFAVFVKTADGAEPLLKPALL